MNCPKCRQPTLRTLQVALQGVEPPLSCTHCGGLWLMRGAAPALRASHALDELPSSPRSSRSEDKRAGLCPYGHGILTRAKATWDHPCYLERCSKCGGVWVDAGEWPRLVELGLVDHLDDIWEPSWRRQLQEDEAAAHLHQDLQQKLGAELAAMVEALGEALKTHPHRALALAYLQESVRHAPPDKDDHRKAKP